VLQTADVALYGADAVPVGQDQVSHLEVAPQIVRKFNHHFAKPHKPILVEPHPYLTDVPKILGLDGRKMSKSYGNAVELGEDPESARKRIMVAVTDPARKRRNDPGHPEVCPIYWLHRAYSPPQTVELVDRECRTAGIGCVDCKKMLLQNLIPALEKHRAARAELDRNPGRVDELVQLAPEGHGGGGADHDHGPRRGETDLRAEVETQATQNGAFAVALPVFEGPLDLLLSLIQDHKLDIFDIPISFVTDRYSST